MKTGIIFFALLVISALASAGRSSSCSQSERNENRKPPEKADNARTLIATSQPGSSNGRYREKGGGECAEFKASEHQWNADVYYSSNQLQRRDVREALLNCDPVLQWRSKNGTSLLDVGSGCGDVTNDIVAQIIPVNFTRLIGIDLSTNMVDFARKRNSDPRISFEEFDIGMELEKQMLRDIEPFDHITSFFCLHWIHNQEVAVENLYKLLQPDGDMFLIFLGQSPLYYVYKALSRNDEWAQYMTDVDEIYSPYTYSENPAAEFHQLLASKGFTEIDVKEQEKSYIFKGYKSFTGMIASIDRFNGRIPEMDRNRYFSDVFELCTKAYPDMQCSIEGSSYTMTYNIMIAYARKLK